MGSLKTMVLAWRDFVEAAGLNPDNYTLRLEPRAGRDELVMRNALYNVANGELAQEIDKPMEYGLIVICGVRVRYDRPPGHPHGS